MKFIRKHTEGPWESLALDYLIERAETIHYLIERAEILNTEISDGFADVFTKESEQELSRILEIIRGAGVSVVE